MYAFVQSLKCAEVTQSTVLLIRPDLVDLLFLGSLMFHIMLMLSADDELMLKMSLKKIKYV